MYEGSIDKEQADAAT